MHLKKAASPVYQPGKYRNSIHKMSKGYKNSYFIEDETQKGDKHMQRHLHLLIMRKLEAKHQLDLCPI
jgi:hypothetical protein